MSESQHEVRSALFILKPWMQMSNSENLINNFLKSAEAEKSIGNFSVYWPSASVDRTVWWRSQTELFSGLKNSHSQSKYYVTYVDAAHGWKITGKTSKVS